MPHISALYCYPVKSCRGIALTEAVLDARGIAHDREFLIVDAQGRFMTQRATPALARIGTALTDDALFLSTDGASELRVPFHASGRAPRTVTIWRDTVVSSDAGDEAAAWVSNVLGEPCRLVSMEAQSRRDVPDARVPEAVTHAVPVAFCDAFPLLVVSEESIADLNRRVGGTPFLQVDRFRPNLVVAGCTGPYAEDDWQTYRVGNVRMFSGGNCVRCIIPTIDPQTLERTPEPLRTLAGYRRSPEGGVWFGQNVIHSQPGARLRIGDEIVPEAWQNVG